MRQIDLLKPDVVGVRDQRPNVEDLHRPKGGYVGDEAVDSRAYVDMPFGRGMKDAVGNENILVEIVPLRGAAGGILLIQDRERRPHGEVAAVGRHLGQEFTAVAVKIQLARDLAFEVFLSVLTTLFFFMAGAYESQ
ncbi:hypothetical protein [Salinisphaera sp. S4-8]|uniref:hypothetical protein n=1 Tax=Salinisphaera sp. S4-8 TaxID=633357 RepID=UPI00333EC06C